MKRLVWMVVLVLALPLAAFADTSVDFKNSGGTLAGSNAGLSLTGSTLIAVDGLGGAGLVTGSLGSVTFTTGALTGSLQNGGTFSSGGSFVMTGNGTNGVPDGVIFSGSFTCSIKLPCRWELVTLANGTHNYSLSGGLKGTWINGSTVFGATVQLTVNTGTGFFNGSTPISGGPTNISTTVPELGTLGLLGTGLVGLAGALHRKFKA